MTQLVHPELSYEVRGVLFHVYNTLGPMLAEEYYKQAIAIGLDKRQIRCETEKVFEVYYEGERVGLYYVDVWIEENTATHARNNQFVSSSIRCCVAVGRSFGSAL